MFREILDLMLDTLNDLQMISKMFVENLLEIMKRRWNDQGSCISNSCHRSGECFGKLRSDIPREYQRESWKDILTIFSKPIDFCCEIQYNSIVRMRKGDKNG